jgi:uncharacterized protein YndB with AHSA1/START domain
MKNDAESLEIVREFDAPRPLVWACWTEPAHMAEWFMPEDMTVPKSETDIRVGGGFRTCLLAEDGTEHWVRGEYREIHPESRLVFTHGWEDAAGEVPHWTLCEIEFEERAGRTTMTFRQSPFRSAGSRDGHAGGWTSAFDNLERHLDRLILGD